MKSSPLEISIELHERNMHDHWRTLCEMRKRAAHLLNVKHDGLWEFGLPEYRKYDVYLVEVG